MTKRVCLLNLFLTWMIVAVSFGLPQSALTEALSIGFLKEEASKNYLDEGNPFSYTVQSAVLEPLFRVGERDGQQHIRLTLVRSFEVSQDGLRWQFELSPEKIFSSGARVRPSDVLFSLQRCAGLDSAVQLSAFESSLSSSGSVEFGVTLEVVRSPDQNAPAIASRDFLSHCPILERESSQIFGGDLGTGTLLVGTGHYFVSHFNDLSKVSLGWLGEPPLAGRPYWPHVQLRIFETAEAALSALRGGGLHILFAEDQTVLSKVENDETLFNTRCSQYTVAARNEVSLNCNPVLDFAKLVVKF
ncbi:MAG: hypothetical protein KDD64_13585 [Bdellovibrionales bacterium]|nr:hypothetical protein [Bdellovibrionales bacterium]